MKAQRGNSPYGQPARRPSPLPYFIMCQQLEPWVVNSVLSRPDWGGSTHTRRFSLYDSILSGQNWAYVRRVADVTQSAAAMNLNISVGYLSCIERGVKRPSIPVLLRAADYYNVTSDYLLGRTERPRG